MIGLDKVGKDTGQGDGGFLVTDQDVPAGVVFEFILSNYNIDVNLLKAEHKTLLDRHVVPLLRGSQAHAEITGTASRTGAASYNRQLSLERADRVRHYLLRKGVPNVKAQASDMKGIGEDKSTSKSDEDELERSVRIRIVAGVRPTVVVPGVLAPQVVPSGPAAAPQTLPEVVIKGERPPVPWAIQELTGVNVSVSFGASAFLVGIGAQAGSVEYHFLLFNRRTRQMAQCRYIGFGAGVGVGPATGGGLKPGIGPGAGISFTTGSKTWDTFESAPGTGFDDFAGAADWHEPASLGLGTSVSSKAILVLKGLGISIFVSTGNSTGTPGSMVSTGNFRLKPPVQLQL